jgi:2-dehydropantoate 2-reductase
LLPPIVHDRSIALVLQNGLHVEQATREVMGEGRVAGGCCFLCSNKVGPGHIRHLDYGKIVFGAYRGVDDGEAAPSMPLLQQIHSDLCAARIECYLTEDLTTSRWKKLMWNIPFNGLSIAEGGVTTDELLRSPEIETEIRCLMQEIVTAARTIGLPLSEDLIDFNIERTRPMGPYRPSSMIDYLEGREVEVGPIWEEPLRRAKQAGVSMPHLETLLERIRTRIAERE